MEEVSYLNEHPLIKAEVVAGAGSGGLLGRGDFQLAPSAREGPGQGWEGSRRPPSSPEKVPRVSSPRVPPARVEPRESNIQIQKRASRTIPN